MKKVLLSLLCLLLLSATTVFAQNSCPVITNFKVNKVSECTKNVSFDFYNPTNGKKSIRVYASCSGGAAIDLGCYNASGQQDVVRSLSTGNFECCDGQRLVITIVSYTGADNCGGQDCETLYSVDGSTPSNSPLPVSFKTISATRNKSKVDVKWTTSTESNNRGFNVQRNTSGVWENVAFVFSAATGGNSSSDLSYSYSDANATKGVTQYRIQQVDIDGKSKLSEIRSVKGETMASSMVVYPNPSETGKINVVFEDQSQKSVQVSDMSGRIVRSLKGVSNNVAIEGLETGVYSIQVTDLSSAAVSVEKVIIKKR